MKPFFKDILDKNVLFGKEIVRKSNQEIFAFFDEQVSAKSTLHKQYDTVFKYVDHYIKDSNNYDYFKPHENKITKDEIHRLHDTIEEEISSSASIVLDVGCGNGWLSSRMLSKGHKVISMDISRSNVIKVLQKYSSESHQGLVADAYHLPMKSNTIDCIIASEVMEHVYDPKLFIESLYRVLKPGGKIIITTPYNERIEYHLCVHCNKSTPSHAHLHTFNKDNIAEFIPSQVRFWRQKQFGNKYFHKTKLSLLLSFLSFKLWRGIDVFFNYMKNNPTRLMLIIEKK